MVAANRTRRSTYDRRVSQAAPDNRSVVQRRSARQAATADKVSSGRAGNPRAGKEWPVSLNQLLTDQPRPQILTQPRSWATYTSAPGQSSRKAWSFGRTVETSASGTTR